MIRRLYDWTLAKAAHPHAEYWLFAFSFMESSFFPIPPHPLLGLMCLANPKRAIRYGLICTSASVLGGLFGYAIGYFLYDSIGAWLLGVLGLAKSFPVAACYLRENAFLLILAKGATPIPFKLVTITAGFIHLDLPTFIAASILSRGFQFMLVGILFRLFGEWAKAFIEKYLLLLSVAFVVLVVGGFFAISYLEHGGGSGADDPCSNVTSLDQLSGR